MVNRALYFNEGKQVLASLEGLLQTRQTCPHVPLGPLTCGSRQSWPLIFLSAWIISPMAFITLLILLDFKEWWYVMEAKYSWNQTGHLCSRPRKASQSWALGTDYGTYSQCRYSGESKPLLGCVCCLTVPGTLGERKSASVCWRSLAVLAYQTLWRSSGGRHIWSMTGLRRGLENPGV